MNEYKHSPTLLHWWFSGMSYVEIAGATGLHRQVVAYRVEEQLRHYVRIRGLRVPNRIPGRGLWQHVLDFHSLYGLRLVIGRLHPEHDRHGYLVPDKDYGP